VRHVLPIALILSGCAVKQYGGVVSPVQGEGKLAPVDFSKIEAVLQKMIAAERENVDRRDRLEAAWELLHEVKTERSAAQHVVHRYLNRLIKLEERGRDGSTGAIARQQDARFTPIAKIKGEEIKVENPPVQTPVVSGQVPVTAGGPAVLDAARKRMNGGDLAGAMTQLEVCKGQPCWAEVQSLWGEVRDRKVYQVQQQAGKVFMAAQSLKDKKVRLEKLQEARRILAEVHKLYPGSRYAPGIAKKIEQVDAAITQVLAN
jgi:hypothetical protein